MPASEIVIGIVGPSKSGKSTLKAGLEERGFTVRHIAQEHSFAPKMWLQIVNPDVLVYLDVSFEQTLVRGQPSWSERDFKEERRRLSHARQHAHIYVHSGKNSLAQVLDIVLNSMTD